MSEHASVARSKPSHFAGREKKREGRGTGKKRKKGNKEEREGEKGRIMRKKEKKRERWDDRRKRR